MCGVVVDSFPVVFLPPPVCRVAKQRRVIDRRRHISASCDVGC